MSELLAGKVQAGFGDASRWLKLFNAAYSEKLGMSSVSTTTLCDDRDGLVPREAAACRARRRTLPGRTKFSELRNAHQTN